MDALVSSAPSQCTFLKVDALVSSAPSHFAESQWDVIKLRRCTLPPPRLRFWRCCASPHDAPDKESTAAPPVLEEAAASGSRKPGSSVETTDWIASSLTRRFGLGAGLAWVGFLAFGVISEQIKTRTEVYLEEQGTRDVVDAKEVVLEGNVRYTDLRIGGGASPQDGDLVLLDLVGRVVDGNTFFDTVSGPKKRPIALVFGRRPYAGGMCAGLEEAVRSMRVGGKRHVVVPAEMGFGASGEVLEGGIVIPSNATLEYTVSLIKASMAPF